MKLSNNHGILQVHYSLPSNDNVKINLYNPYGSLVYQSISGIKPQGEYTESLDLARMGLPQGTYLVKVSTGSYREVLGITMVK